jgi:hypothetical protein
MADARDRQWGRIGLLRQSGETTESGGRRGYDAGKKVPGRKRHAMGDTDRGPLVLHVHPASVQDRDGAVPLLKTFRRGFLFVERAFADATCIAVEIVRKLQPVLAMQGMASISLRPQASICLVQGTVESGPSFLGRDSVAPALLHLQLN